MKTYLNILLMALVSFLFIGCNPQDAETTITTETIQTNNQTTADQVDCSFNINLDVSNGTDVIQTTFVMCVAYGKGTGVDFTADGFCYPYDFVENKDTFALINDTEAITLESSKLVVLDIEVFDMDGVMIMTWTSIEDHPSLTSGDYIIRLSTRLEEDECIIEGDNYFILRV